jgi:hypothetical protein
MKTRTPRRNAPIECPDCGSDDWQRIELAYNAGTSCITGSAVLAGGGGLSAGLLSGTTRTRFAESIAPPAKYSVDGVQMLGVIGLAGSIGGPAIMSIFQHESDNDLFQIGKVLLIAGLCVVVPAIIAGIVISSYNSRKWPRLFAEWRRHYVCLRCGCVWIP